MTIPRVTPITVQPRQLNARLWLLHGREVAGTITASERLELDVMCAALEAGQDNEMPTIRKQEECGE